eukprot:TRINITY_DN221_c0_g3_i3.p1 TRINITY_DN221_c0_g3~~TRINITY_DN221_c0_g3_i3.p1  ORF type:complete len:195 (+),score=38.80 TRINITY_DN221_c0_g3_i3:60-644(+)
MSHSDGDDRQRDENEATANYNQYAGLTLPSFGRSMQNTNLMYGHTADGVEFLDDAQDVGFMKSLCLSVGTTTLVGAFAGGMVGIVETARWNPPSGSVTNRLRVNKLLNTCGRNGTRFATNFGSLATIFECSKGAIQYIRDEDDPLNGIAGGAITGFAYRSFAGLKTAGKSALFGLVVAGCVEYVRVMADRVHAF